MFSSTGLFKKIPCPLKDDCKSSEYCLFSHDDYLEQALPKEVAGQNQFGREESISEGPRNSNKRRRLNPTSLEKLEPTPNSRSSETKTIPTVESKPSKATENQKVGTKKKESDGDKVIERRPISPPPLLRENRGTLASETDKQAESLNPRQLKISPAAHASRNIYLKKIHENISRLNNVLASADDDESKLLCLSEKQLIKIALDEEERIAQENYSIYGNVIKNRILSLSKMTVEQWKLERLKSNTDGRTKPVQAEQAIETGLCSSEKDISVLQHLLSEAPFKLEKYGYITAVPTDLEIAKARDGVRAADGWEQCARCKSRFQVFSQRRPEDGALTSGGECTYHPGKIQAPDNKGSEKTFTCCNARLGSSIGCATASSHVFKVDDGPRLASVCQFKEAHQNPDARRAVSFDCEMGFTTNGMELIRLTVLSWPEGNLLLDVLVRPFGAILDLNTRYSGVRAEDFTKAKPHSTAKQQKPENRQLEVVDSPMAARELLFQLISPTTVLVGHGLENDLNAARIVHKDIADSVFYYPHRRGLPFRLSLKRLAKDVLERDIQLGGDGHDPQEDAKAAGDLVRVKVAKQWRLLRSEGWTFSLENPSKLELKPR